MSTHRKTSSKSEKLAAIYMANTEGIAKASRHFNVSQTSLYKWKQKLESLGESALERHGGDQLSQQNAHIESYHSIIERMICSRYEFEGFGKLPKQNGKRA